MTSKHNDIFAPVRTQNPLEETVAHIAGAIKARLLSPGDQLPPERELAARLGVSRSTLREALAVLMRAGYLEVRRGRSGGTFVARWYSMPQPRQLPQIIDQKRDELAALLDYRRAVESMAAALAAERASLDEITELRTILAGLEGQEHAFEIYRAGDARFHVGIARAAHSPRLLRAVNEVQAAMTELLDVIIYHSVLVLRHSSDYHRDIISAIAHGDSEGARRTMLAHVMATESIIYGLVPEIEPLPRLDGRRVLV